MQLHSAVRMPLRQAGGQFATAGRFDGDNCSRMGRHSSKARDRVVRSMRKGERRELNRVSVFGWND